jgi:hypothetical protein
MDLMKSRLKKQSTMLFIQNDTPNKNTGNQNTTSKGAGLGNTFMRSNTLLPNFKSSMFKHTAKPNNLRKEELKTPVIYKRGNSYRAQIVPIMIESLSPKLENMEVSDRNSGAKISKLDSSGRSWVGHGDEDEFNSASDSGAVEMRYGSNKNLDSNKVIVMPFVENVQ